MEEFPKIVGDVSANALIRHRIVQHEGRRYSIKLEEGFWRFLDACAKRRGMRLNRLVGTLAGSHPEGLGFAASLRLFCLQEAAARLTASEIEIKALGLAAGTTDLGVVVKACPSPCLVLSHRRVISLANEAFAKWLQVDVASLEGKPVEHFFQIRGHFRLDDLWVRFGSGLAQVVPAKIAYVAPGRVVVAKANLCPAAVKGPEDFSCLILLDLVPHR
ncbi:MAG: ribbon-helix-helix domain-containing protein [Alphaproteobacteria bacterium]